MKSEFDVRMQYHRETGIVAGPDEIYCPECDEVIRLNGQVAVDERYYDWLIEKVTNPEVKVVKEVPDDLIEKVNDDIDDIINQLSWMKL